MTGYLPADLVIGAAAVLAALAALWRATRPLRATQANLRDLGELLPPLKQMVEDWHGEPARPGYPAEPSMPERMAVVESRTKQLEGNGGTHLADKIDQIRADVREVRTEAREAVAEAVASVNRRVTDHRRRQDETIERLEAHIEAMAEDRIRAEAMRAALVELGIEAEPPPPRPKGIRDDT